MDPDPWVRSGGPVGHPPKAGAFGRFPGSRENPWALFAFFLSLQKEGPPEGQTRHKTFRTRQDCEGPDWRVAVKRKRDYRTKPTGPRKKSKPPNETSSPGRHVQEAALRACLEG